MAATRPEWRLVTHHESYIGDPEAELRRVLNWLGWSVSGETIVQACEAVSTLLRHHWVTYAELQQARISSEGLALYESLCSEAGPVYEWTLNDPAPRPALTRPRSASARAGPESPYLQQVIEQQQIEALGLEWMRLQSAFAAQERWARDLEKMARGHQATIRACQRAPAPILPRVRAVRKVRKRLTGA